MKKELNSFIYRKTDNYTIEINADSGFCFGVVNAIEHAEDNLKKNEQLYCLGDIVHNEKEVERLKKMGLKTITTDEFNKLKSGKVLFRAHGEPPERYSNAENKSVDLIDATCPVVLKIQQRIKTAYQNMLNVNGQVVIYGKKNHAEVVGLEGQTNYEAIVVEDESDLFRIDYSKPVELFSQTTMSLDSYKELAKKIQARCHGQIKIHDTICRQVANRSPKMQEFAKNYDVVIFVGGEKSSNAKLLFNACKSVNDETHFVSDPLKLKSDWFKNKKRIGICGATSTPLWLMEETAKNIEKQLTSNKS